MSDLTNFQRGQIVDSRLFGASVTTMAKCVFQCQPTALLRALGSVQGVECGLFSIHPPLGQTTLRVGRISV